MTSSNRGYVASSGEMVAIEPRPQHRFGTKLVAVERLHNVKELAPAGPGPWAGEADEIAWTDGTNYSCLVRRDGEGGHLCGHVGVGGDHPLFGFGLRALLGLDLVVHGGVKRAGACQACEPENVPVCRVRDGLDDAWWIGFECDGPSDVLPNGSPDSRGGAGTGERIYRDEAYVYAEVVSLARQLKDVEDSIGAGSQDRGLLNVRVDLKGWR